VQADLAALVSRPSLAAWRKNHPGERLDRAHYESYKDDYEVDFARLNRWCAASVDQAPGKPLRVALFYVPSLPSPGPQVRTGDCELDAIWYETQNLDTRDSLVHELSASWGEPNGASAEPDIRGWGLWKSIVGWHISDTDIWVANDPNTTQPGRKPRLLVYMRRTMPRDFDVMDRWFGSVIESQAVVADAVAQIAGLDPALTSPILSHSRCSEGPAERNGDLIEPLARWLAAAKALTPSRRSAALLLADFYVTCAGTSPDPDRLQKSLTEFGAKYETRFVKDGPDYAHNFREQAEMLDPRGPAGELAGFVSLTDPCFLKGSTLQRGQAWPDLVIEKGTKMLTIFPPTRWTPYVHYALARAHAVKLSFALPGGAGDDGDLAPLSAAVMQEERSAAITQFRYFLKKKPGTESVFASQEAWRLLAGLPPSQIHFGCTGE